MSRDDFHSPLLRRSFLSRFAASFAATGAALAGTSAGLRAQSSGASSWQPARHAQDYWLSQLPGTHRFIIDSTSPDGFTSALQYANNYFAANQTGYGLKDNDLAVVIVARHHATQFAYNNAIWS